MKVSSQVAGRLDQYYYRAEDTELLPLSGGSRPCAHDPHPAFLLKRRSSMSTLTGIQLAQGIRQRIEDLKKACNGIDETSGSCAPAGRWTPKEVLSHLLGPEESSHIPLFKLFLDKENPTIPIDPGNAHYSRQRAQMTFSQLLAEVEKEYERIAAFAEGLSEEQLARKARIPQLKESPLGEFPTLAELIKGLGQYHIRMHIDQIQEILTDTKA